MAAWLVALALVVGCSGGSERGDAASSSTASGSTTSTTAAPATRPVPGASWQRVAPDAVGLDPAALERSASTAEEGGSDCLVVVRDGAIAGEWTFGAATPTTTRNVFSVTKSITSILVGIARDEGALSLDDAAAEWIPEWRDTPAEAVTVRNLLAMDSGREWSVGLDYGELVRQHDQTAFAVGLDQEHPPGEVWAYNNAAVQTLERVLSEATGEEVEAFAQQRLFEPLGMADTRMNLDGSGNALTYMGVESTCEDLARFGLLLLHEGAWGGEQIVSADFVAEATARASTELNVGYGLLFWRNEHGPIGNPLVATDLAALDDPDGGDGQLAPGAPEDLFWAIGLGNQIVQVHPGTDTVVTRLGAGGVRPRPPTFGPTEAAEIVTGAVVD